MKKVVHTLAVTSTRSTMDHIGDVYRVDRGRARWGASLLLKKLPVREAHLGYFRNKRNAQAALRKANERISPAERAALLRQEDEKWEAFFAALARGPKAVIRAVAKALGT